MTTGITSFGVIRKRMADLLNDLAFRIKESGAFGSLTTLDSPDLYPGDPLVQIATAASASDHELWEAVEFFYAQLNPDSSSGIYLEKFHGEPRFGLTKRPDETREEYNAKILELIRNGAARYDPDVIALQQANVKCARQLFSTVANPIDGIPAPGSMLVVKGCDIDYEALAALMWEKSEIGQYDWYGDQIVDYATQNNGCVRMRFQPACPVIIDINVQGYLIPQECGEIPITEGDVLTDVLSVFNGHYDACGLGANVKSSALLKLLGGLPGFVATGVGIRPRPKRLYYDGCDYTSEPEVTVCGETGHWASYEPASGDGKCSYCGGEEWCVTDWIDCWQLKPWQYPLFDISFAQISAGEGEQC